MSGASGAAPASEAALAAAARSNYGETQRIRDILDRARAELERP